METVLITVPQMVSDAEAFTINNESILGWAQKQKNTLDGWLKIGFRVKCMTTYIYQGVPMIHYALEKEDSNVHTENV